MTPQQKRRHRRQMDINRRNRRAEAVAKNGADRNSASFISNLKSAAYIISTLKLTGAEPHSYVLVLLLFVGVLLLQKH